MFMLLMACREPFEPEVTDIDFSILVVEGHIEIGDSETLIRLSRTIPLGSQDSVNPVRAAQVSVESISGQNWSLVQSSPGSYSGELNLPENQDYRLRISMPFEGQVYLSEWLEPIITPEIEQVGFTQQEDWVEIFASTQGSEENQYFIWDYEETWRFRPAIISGFIYDPEVGNVVMRNQDQRTDVCWLSSKSTGILIESSSRFSNDFIPRKEITRIPAQSERLGQRYSILVKQRAISREMFDFWEIMRKNSDDLGGIFSPLPSLVRSNVFNENDPNESVIGYVSAGKSSQKRFYISFEEIAPWRVVEPAYAGCRIYNDTVSISEVQGEFGSGSTVPVIGISNDMGFMVGYRGAPRACTDCTLRGTKERPEFWED
ncbi:DUF4249 domain-containing protein [Pararhodonellum marinum]|uniref:DUF4249 domain-containing protein n=1 Tax=Pararhodonellum marinum TaxID=2755358 RepID=UPI00188FE874|nr:DUF4249 domain-containing protein [Pararhodonellum marinum]